MRKNSPIIPRAVLSNFNSIFMCDRYINRDIENAMIKPFAISPMVK